MNILSGLGARGRTLIRRLQSSLAPESSPSALGLLFILSFVHELAGAKTLKLSDARVDELVAQLAASGELDGIVQIIREANPDIADQLFQDLAEGEALPTADDLLAQLQALEESGYLAREDALRLQSSLKALDGAGSSTDYEIYAQAEQASGAVASDAGAAGGTAAAEGGAAAEAGTVVTEVGSAALPSATVGQVFIPAVAVAAAASGISAGAAAAIAAGTAAAASGRLADGYIRGAEVKFYNANNQVIGTTTTDAQGNFTVPASATGYARIEARGGFNIDTGVANTIVMKAPAGATMVSPLTTLVQNFIEKNPGTSVTSANSSVATALGLPTGYNLATFDPIASGTADAVLIQKAAAKVATIAQSAANDRSSGTIEEVINKVLDNLVTKIQAAVSAPAGTTVNLADTTVLGQILQGSGTNVTANALQTTITSIVNAASISAISQAQASSDLLDTIRPDGPQGFTVVHPQSEATTSTLITKDTQPTVRVALDISSTDGTAAVVGNKVTLYVDGTAVQTDVVLTQAHITAGYIDIRVPSSVASGLHTFNAIVKDGVGANALSAGTAQDILVVSGQTLTVAANQETGTVNFLTNQPNADDYFTTLDLVDNGISLTDVQAVALVDAGLHFDASDTAVAMSAAAGTLLHTSLSGMQSLGVDTVTVSGSSESLSIDMGPSGSTVDFSSLPTFNINSNVGLTLNVADGQVGQLADPDPNSAGSPIASLASAGFDYIAAADGSLTIDSAIVDEIRSTGMHLRVSDDITMSVRSTNESSAIANLVADIDGNTYVANSIDSIDVVDNAITISDAQAAVLVDGGLDFAANDVVTLTAASTVAGTQLQTTLSGMQSLGVDIVSISGEDGAVGVQLGTGAQLSSLPDFQFNQNIRLGLGLDDGQASLLSDDDLSTADPYLTNLRNEGFDAIYANDGSLTIDSVRAQSIIDAGLELNQSNTFTVTVAQSAESTAISGFVSAIQSQALGSGEIDHLDVADNSISITDAQASVLVGAGIDFVAGDDQVTLTASAAGTFLQTSLKGMQTLGVDAVNIDGSSGAIGIHMGTGVDFAELPTVTAASGVKVGLGIDDNQATVLADLDPNTSDPVLTQLATAGFDAIFANDGSLTLDAAQVNAIRTAGLGFRNSDDITMSIRSAGETNAINTLVGNIDTNNFTVGSVDHLDLVGNAITITDAQAASLVTGGLNFAANDVVTISGAAGTQLHTTLSGMQSLGVDAVSVSGSTGDFGIRLGTGAVDFAHLPTITAAQGVRVGLGINDDQVGLLADLNPNTVDAQPSQLAAAGFEVVYANDGSLTLDAAQVNAIRTAGLSFNAADDITMSIRTAGEETAINSIVNSIQGNTFANGSIDHLDVVDDAITITDEQAAVLVTRTLDFAAEDIVTVTGAAGTQLQTSLIDLQELGVDHISLTGSSVADTVIQLGSGHLDIAHLPTVAHADQSNTGNINLGVNDAQFENPDPQTMAADYAAVHAAGFTTIDANDNSLTLALDTVVAVRNAELNFAQNDTITVSIPSVGSGSVSSILHGDTLDLVNNLVSITDAQAEALVDSGLSFAADDNVTISAAAGTQLHTTLSGMQSLGVDAISISGATGNLGIQMGTGVDFADLPTVTAASGVKVGLGIDDNQTTVLADLDPNTSDPVLTQLVTAGFDAVFANDGSLTLDAAQINAIRTAGLGFRNADDITMSIRAAGETNAINTLVGNIDTNNFTVGSVDHLNLVDNGITLTDAEAASLVNGGLNFAADDVVTISAAAGTHLHTTLTGMQHLGVDHVTVLGEDSANLTVDYGSGAISASAVPQFDLGDTVKLSVTESQYSANLSSALSGLSAKGIDEISVVLSDSLGLQQADLNLNNVKLASLGIELVASYSTGTVTLEDILRAADAGTFDYAAGGGRYTGAILTNDLGIQNIHIDDVTHFSIGDTELKSMLDANVISADAAADITVEDVDGSLALTLAQLAELDVNHVHTDIPSQNAGVTLSLNAGVSFTNVSELSSALDQLVLDFNNQNVGTTSNNALFDLGDTVELKVAGAHGFVLDADLTAKLNLLGIDDIVDENGQSIKPA